MNDTGDWDAVHPLHRGLRAQSDHRVLDTCLDEGRVLVTENSDDFKRLIVRAGVHAGLIVLPCLNKQATWTLLLKALSHIKAQPDPQAWMINKVIEVGEDATLNVYDLP